MTTNVSGNYQQQPAAQAFTQGQHATMLENFKEGTGA
jgi:hypothetical protein